MKDNSTAEPPTEFVMGETVFEDLYECPVCCIQIAVRDFDHRTHIGYDAASVRCNDCDQPMERVD
jgi:hypothetical protein